MPLLVDRVNEGGKSKTGKKNKNEIEIVTKKPHHNYDINYYFRIHFLPDRISIYIYIYFVILLLWLLTRTLHRKGILGCEI